MNPMSDVELRIGVQPIEELLAQRRVLIDRVADMRARFGPFGTADHLRKIELSRLHGLVRAQALRDKRRITNQQVDEEAHAHPDYYDFVTAMTVKRAEWVKLEAQIEEIDMTINRGQAVARYLALEARL